MWYDYAFCACATTISSTLARRRPATTHFRRSWSSTWQEMNLVTCLLGHLGRCRRYGDSSCATTGSTTSVRRRSQPPPSSSTSTSAQTVSTAALTAAARWLSTAELSVDSSRGRWPVLRVWPTGRAWSTCALTTTLWRSRSSALWWPSGRWSTSTWRAILCVVTVRCWVRCGV